MIVNEIPTLPVYGFDPMSITGLLSLVIAVVLPLLVGLMTKRSWGSGTKATLLLVFAAVKSFIEAWLDAANTSQPFLWTAVAVTILTNFMIAVAVHFGLWKPWGTADAAQRSLVKDEVHPYGATRR